MVYGTRSIMYSTTNSTRPLMPHCTAKEYSGMMIIMVGTLMAITKPIRMALPPTNFQREST